MTSQQERCDELAAHATEIMRKVRDLSVADVLELANQEANVATYSHNDWIAAVHHLQLSNLCLTEAVQRLLRGAQ